MRIIKKLKPKYVVWENVRNVLSKKHIHNFEEYLKCLEKIGYKNYYKVLNAKDYGVPQNRQRLFCVSILNGDKDYQFPAPFGLDKKLKDILETDVDEKSYLSPKGFKYVTNENRLRKKYTEINGDIAITLTARGQNNWTGSFVGEIKQIGQIYGTEREPNPQAGRIYSADFISPTLDSCSGGNRMPKIIDEPFIVASRGRNPDNPSDRTAGHPTKQRLEPKFDGTTNTLTTVQKDNYVCEPQNMRIRKLTPKECWRLMGFDDNDFEKAEKVNSNTQLYKQAGNSIVVNVLVEIFKKLFLDD